MDRIGLITTGVAATDARQRLDMPLLRRNVALKPQDPSIPSEQVIGFAR